MVGATSEEVRRHNLAAVLARLHREGAVSRTSLSAELGLNRSTIGGLVGDLVSHGLVREEVPPPTRAGRPSLVVCPETERVTVLAADLGAGQLSVARVGLGGRILDRREARLVDHLVDEVVDVVVQLCHELDGDRSPEVRTLALGVGVPGVVRRSDGQVRFAPNLRWRDEPFAARLAGAVGMPVHAGNNADLGVLAEHWRGAAVGFDDVLYLVGEVGVGGGVLVGGKPLAGTGGYAGEVGHLRISQRELPCRCGARGCWETEIGEAALLAAAGRTPGGGLPAIRAVVRAAADGDGAAAGAVAHVARWLGIGLGTLVNVFNPAIIVLGGALAEVLAGADAQVRAGLAESAMAVSAEQVRLTAAALTPDSVLIGAAELAFHDLLSDPLAGGKATPAAGV